MVTEEKKRGEIPPKKIKKIKSEYTELEQIEE
jgi:hypothetical protein